MKWSRSRTLAVLGGWLALVCCAGSAAASPGSYGKITGVVLDPGGTPHKGVSVWLMPQAVNARVVVARLLTDQNGIFSSPELRPGVYSLRANLSGFLPAVQQVRIAADLTTLVQVRLDSVFSSADNLRRQSAQPSERDDWKWVLRTSAASRPVLQLRDGTLVVREGPEEDTASHRPDRARVEMSNGLILPGSPSGDPGTLGTAAALDQGLGFAGRLLVAGEMGYDPAGGDTGALSGEAATIWLPRGELNQGPETIAILQQGERVGNLLTPRAGRIEHEEQMTLTDHLLLKYAGEVMVGGVGGMTATVRPSAQLLWKASPDWSVVVALETDPESQILDRDDGSRLQSAVDALSTAPVMIWRDGEVSSLQGGWHEEISVRRAVGTRGSLQASGFHDFFEHEAVFGIDSIADPNIPESLLGEAYAHDAGAGETYGTRIVYTEKLTTHLEAAAIYTWSGALSPNSLFSNASLQDALQMRYLHSVAGRVSAKLPRSGTVFAASYKWIDGLTVGRQDLFGEAALGIDPYLSVSIKQRLPALHAGHWEAMCSVRNVLAQGYLPLTTEEGKMLSTPVERSVQGGVSVQF